MGLSGGSIQCKLTLSYVSLSVCPAGLGVRVGRSKPMRASSRQAQMIRCHPKVSWEHSVKGSRNSRPVRSHCLPCLPRTLCLTAGQSVHNNWRIADARPRTLGSISMYLQHLLPPDTLPTVVEACSASMQPVKQGFGAFLVLSDCDWRFSVFVPTHHCECKPSTIQPDAGAANSVQDNTSGV